MKLSDFSINSTLFAVALLFARNATLAPAIRPYWPALATKLEQPSRMQDFQNWDNLHEIVSAATRAAPHPIAVESYQVLSELLFHDSVVRADKRIGEDRLKIWAEGSRKSQFDLEDQYQLDPDKPFWLVGRNLDHPPVDCNLYQTLFKSPTELQTFLIYRCNF